MTPEERKLVTDLFDRLATLEDAQRDPEAERAIRDGLRQAPNAVYALVQTALVQDEALKRADARIRELEDAGQQPAQRDTSFLGSMREAVWGPREPSRAGSVPSVRPNEAAPGMSPAWRTTSVPPTSGAPAYPPMGAQPMGQPGGGSFLGTAAAAAAGVIGGSLLLSGIRNMMGPHGSAHAAFDPAAGGGGSSPLSGGGGSIAGSDLSRQAGLDDIGRTPAGGGVASDAGQGLFGDSTSATPADDPGADDFDDGGGFDLDDDGGFDGGEE
jgi:hypothetical protein